MQVTASSSPRTQNHEPTQVEGHVLAFEYFGAVPGRIRYDNLKPEYRSPGELKSPQADAIIVAPGTFNTINKWANGISDTYALGILAEAPGLNIPVVALPFVNSALADRAPFKDSVNTLRSEGVRILLGPGEFEPHLPGSGGDRISDFPWQLAIASVSD
jgi:hypothetical protein